MIGKGLSVFKGNFSKWLKQHKIPLIYFCLYFCETQMLLKTEKDKKVQNNQKLNQCLLFINYYFPQIGEALANWDAVSRRKIALTPKYVEEIVNHAVSDKEGVRELLKLIISRSSQEDVRDFHENLLINLDDAVQNSSEYLERIQSSMFGISI